MNINFCLNKGKDKSSKIKENISRKIKIIMEHFGKWLKTRLNEAGMTQKKLAKDLGVTDQAVSLWIKSGEIGVVYKKQVMDYFEALEGKSGQPASSEPSKSQPIDPGAASDGYNPAAYERLLEEREARLKEKDQMISSYERTISLLESQLKWLQESFTAKLTPNFRKGVHAGRNLMGIHYNRMRDAQVPQVKLG